MLVPAQQQINELEAEYKSIVFARKHSCRTFVLRKRSVVS